MHIQRHETPEAFLQTARTLLEAREAYHNLPLAIARTCAEDPERYPGPNYLATAHDGDVLVGCALMTPPHRVLAFVPLGEAVEALAADLEEIGVAVSGVHGTPEVAHAFAETWCPPRSLEARRHTHLRGFVLEQVTPAPPTPGRMRRAEEADAALVSGWYVRFIEESGALAAGMSAAALGERAVRQGRAFLWEDDAVVAQAVTSPATERGMRIGAVYTPPERRRNGYATALVGALSQHLLDAGASWCALYTDLANPISNAIYPKVGYRPLGDFVDLDFHPTRPQPA